MTPQEAIAKAQTELNQHREEWEQRFIQYMSQTVANRDKIKERRKKFHKWANLSVYSTIGNAKDNKPVFDLRYQGQSVGSIVIRGNDVRLVISEKQHKNSSNPKYFNGYPKDYFRLRYDDFKSFRQVISPGMIKKQSYFGSFSKINQKKSITPNTDWRICF